MLEKRKIAAHSKLRAPTKLESFEKALVSSLLGAVVKTAALSWNFFAVT